MAFRNKLPDSLELLLDTMCNTFGGVMFIAISLLVISSLASKVAEITDPTENDLRRIEAVEEHIASLRQELAALEAEQQTILQQMPARTPEQSALVAELQQLTQTLTRLQRETNDLQTSNRALERRIKLTQIAQQKETRLLSEESLDNQKRQKELHNELLKLERENQRLKNAIQNRRPRQLTFSYEDATSLAPYWMLMCDNTLYRIGPMNEREYPIPDVVQTTAANGTLFAYTPRSGFKVGARPTGELEYIFREINPKRYFIDVFLSPESFDTFIALKEYLREHAFQVNWHFTNNKRALLRSAVNPDYQASK